METALPPEGQERRAFDEILNEIKLGSLRPGDPVGEKRAGISQSSVRQALIRLEHAGLVERRRHQPTKVVNLTKNDIRELIAVRTPLETLAWTSAQSRLSEPIVEQTIERRLARIADVGGDEAFHRYVWGLSDNKLLIRTLNQLTTPMFAFVGLLRRTGAQNTVDRVRSHAALLESVRRGSDSSLRSAVQDHIADAYAGFLAADDITDLRGLALRGPIQASAGSIPPLMGWGLSKQQEFLQWLPASALILDATYHVVYANEDFERFSGKRFRELEKHGLRDQFWCRVHNEILEATPSEVILAVQNTRGEKRLALCFRVRNNMVGEIGFDIAPLVPLTERRRTVAEPVNPVRPTSELITVAPDVLNAYFDALPAIATWKDVEGRMTWANIEYERVTGKRRDAVIGMLPTMNWPGPVGEMILARDSEVRRGQRPYLTHDTFGFDTAPRRVTIRFPTFDSAQQLNGTASLGFDFELVKRASAMLQTLGEDEADFERRQIRQY